MITVFSGAQQAHHATAELIDGTWSPPFERPERAEQILARLSEVGLGPVVAPRALGLEAILRVHSQPFVDFLRTAHSQWTAVHGDSDALPLCWPTRDFRQVEPQSIDGKLSYYSFDAGTPITAGTWDAIKAAADVAVTGAMLLGEGERSAFALCRPPGHHASRDVYGGYCFLNNAAIAARALGDAGARRVAILDIDYHHGNGTQAIFYDTADVLFVSLHADPVQEFPFFLGYPDETGAGAGEGFNLNLPLPMGTQWPDWRDALDAGLARISAYAPDALVVSLGVDTFAGDPISHFRLASENYLGIGSRIARLRQPTLLVLEGGYALEEIGLNTVNVLSAFDG